MKLLIELPTWLGDCVMTTPAIENIISKYPNCRIIFIGSKVSIELMRYHSNHIDSMILERNVLSLYSQIKKIGSVDMFLSFRSSMRTKLISFFLNSNQKFQYKKNLYSFGHQVERYNMFINDSLLINRKPKNLVIYGANPKAGLSKPVMGINPGASYGSAKCWPYEKYAEIAVSLSKKFDILIFGGNKELNLVEKIESKLKENNCKNYVNLAGRTSTKELIDYISSLDLFITGDSGPMHIAAAFRIPTVSIFGPTKEYETCQWMNDKSRIIKKDLACQPCMKRVCPLKHHDCMKKISSREVINAALSLT